VRAEEKATARIWRVAATKKNKGKSTFKSIAK
jgi:hypothetical protein